MPGTGGVRSQVSKWQHARDKDEATQRWYNVMSPSQTLGLHCADVVCYVVTMTVTQVTVTGSVTVCGHVSILSIVRGTGGSGGAHRG